MDYIRSRSEQLAIHLREQIRSGALAEPLPNTRDWAARLGVSCETLYDALHVLERERLIAIRPRQGIYLQSQARNAHAFRSGQSGERRAPATAKVVRIVYHGNENPAYVNTAQWHGLLAQRLQRDDIELQVEKCHELRLRALGSGGPARRSLGGGGELLLLQSLSPRHQLMFSRSGRPCLILGYRAAGVSLPFVVPDFEGAIRHATHLLLRSGFARLHLLIRPGGYHAVQVQRDAFRAACAAWPHQPVFAEVLDVPVAVTAQLSTLDRFAARIKSGHGIIVVSPIGADAVMTSLYARGVAIAKQARLAVIEALSPPRALSPMPVWYSASQEAWVRTIARDAAHFFETGRVPAMDKTLAVEVRP